DKNEIVEKYTELDELIKESHSDNLIMFEIHKIRYFLIMGEFDRALAQINELEEISSTFDSLHQFYWFKFKGNYKTVNGDFKEAMRKYKQAEEKLNQMDMEEEEVADLQYTIAVTHSKLRNMLEVIEYDDKALDTFRKQYNFIRCGECHIILGISYRRIRMYSKSIKNHNLAKHLGKLSENKQIIQLANHNLGYLHSTRGDTEDAIELYVEVVQDPDVDMNAKFPAVASLIKEYFHIENYDKAEEMIKLGLELLQDMNGDDSFKVFYYILYTYKYAIDGEYDKFENIVVKQFLPYLKKHNDYDNIATYTTMLANYYEKLYQYKDAAHYYELANQAYKELINI